MPCGSAAPAFAQVKAPASPVTITVVDVAGNLALTQGMLEAYAAAKPEWVSSFAFTKAPAPELPAKIKAQQAAGKVDIDLVLTGTDVLAAGLDQGLWIDLQPTRPTCPICKASFCRRHSRCRRWPRSRASS